MQDQDPTDDMERSLQELKALRSQLHYAADYCEMTFLTSKHKNKVVENTKKYICKSMVTVVDHLGSASANLDSLIRRGLEAEASPIQIRIDSLKQRLLTCQIYTGKVDLAQVCWNPNFPRHHACYTTPSQKVAVPHGREGGAKSYSQKLNTVDEKDSVFDIKKLNTQLTSGFEPSEALPVFEGPSILWRPRNLSFPSGDHQLAVLNEKSSKKTSVSKKSKRMM